MLVDFERTADLGAVVGDGRDDGGVQPDGHQPRAGHAEAFQLGGDGGGFGVGGRFAVYRQIAAQQQIHGPAHGGVVGGAFQRTELAVKQDAVLLAEAVQPRHAEGVVAHDVDGVGVLVEQDLPAFIECLHAEGDCGHIADFYVWLRGLDPGGFSARLRVEHDGAAAQRGKGAGQADLLPVIQALLARRPAVKLRNDDGFHVRGNTSLWE